MASYPFLAPPSRLIAKALRKAEAKTTASVAASAPPARLPPKKDAAATLAPEMVNVVAISTQPVTLKLRVATFGEATPSFQGER